MTDRYDALRKAMEAIPGPQPGPYWHESKLDDRRQWERVYTLDAYGQKVSLFELWGGQERDQATAMHLAGCDPGTIQSLLSDADRYNAFFVAGLPITFMGEEYRTKKDLDAAIDAFLAEQKGGAT